MEPSTDEEEHQEETETVKVVVNNVVKLQKELAEIRSSMKQAKSQESNAKHKMENLEKFKNRRENDTFGPSSLPSRESGRGRRDSRRGGFRDRRGGDRNRRDMDRGGDRRGGRERRNNRGFNDRRDRNDEDEKNFYGLARSSAAAKSRRQKESQEREQNRNAPYKSQYADAESSSEEEEEQPPTTMISLVTVDSDKEDGEKSGASDSDSDSESASEKGASVKEEPIQDRGRKRVREEKGDTDRKRKRVSIIASMKKDKKSQTRSKRLFGFMMQHLGRAKKESKDKTDSQAIITKKAQVLKTQQKRIIDKDFQEKQKEKYEARMEYNRKFLEVQNWKKKHIENLLRADGMKTELKTRNEMIDSGIFLTTAVPPITWKPATELDQEFMVSIQEKCKEGLQVVLDKEIQEMMDNEGEEPEQPEPLLRKYQVSPIRGRREDDDNNNDNRKGFGGFRIKREGGNFGSKREGFGGRFNFRLGSSPSSGKREEPSRRDRSRERTFRGPRQRNVGSGKKISTRGLRNRRDREPRERKDRRSLEKKREVKTVKDEPTPQAQPSMMSLVSVAED